MTDASNPQNPKPERISVRHMFEVLLSAFNLDRGLGYTLKSLLIHPKKAVNEYLFEDRKRMVHPLRFLFFTTAIAVFLELQFDMTETEEGDRIDQAVTQFVTDHLNLLMIALVPAATLSSWLFFKKRNLYFGEHLALNSYAVSFQNIIYMAIMPLLAFHSSIDFLHSGLAFLYLLYFYIGVFKTESGKHVVTAFGAVLTSYAIYIFLIAISLLVFIGCYDLSD